MSSETISAHSKMPGWLPGQRSAPRRVVPTPATLLRLGNEPGVRFLNSFGSMMGSWLGGHGSPGGGNLDRAKSPATAHQLDSARRRNLDVGRLAGTRPQGERAAVKLIQGRVARLTAKAARRDVVGRAVLRKDCLPALRAHAASGRVGGHDVRSIIWPPCEMSHRRPTEELLTLAQPSSPEGCPRRPDR